ncbi:MAG: thymidine kinase [Bacilli bacterium]|nr:thymidine kinase [Bacilli bacterium]
MNDKNGSIEIIVGPMFAGKSEEILRRIRRLKYAKKKYLVFKPKIDNRYEENKIVSHIKNEADAISIKQANEILKFLNDDIDAVIIDEVQFFDENIIEICENLANDGKRVIVSGLDMDFRGEAFKITSILLCKAEVITKLTAICLKCGNPATRSQRIINGQIAKYSDPIICVGASEKYEPRCRKCHIIIR